MPKSVTGLDLTKLPFGRAHSEIMIYQEDSCDGENFKPGLYFAMLIQGGAPRRKGLVDLEPIVDGQPVDFTYKATPAQLRMETEKGSVTVVIDTPRTVRIRGEGVGIRLYTKIPFLTMENATMLPGGLADLNLLSINNDGGRLLFKALEGEIELESVFDVLKNGPDDAKVEFLPGENGAFEIVGYLMNPDEWGYIDPLPIGDAAAAAMEDYEAFEKIYPEVGAQWQELKDICAYTVWLHQMGPNDREILPTVRGDLIFSNSMTAGWANTGEQALHAMAMDDTSAAVKLISDTYLHMSKGMLPVTVSTKKTHYQASPPAFGAAIVEILDRINGEIPADEVSALYKAMAENYAWWQQSHSFAPHRFSYNHRDEIGLPGASYSALEFPLETPDIYTFMILFAEALSKLSAIVGDDKAAQWKSEQAAVTEELLGLWNGEAFECRAVTGGQRVKSESLLAYLPVILGARLPKEIIEKLLAALGDEDKFMSARGFRSESKQSAYYDPNVAGRGAVNAWLQQLIVCALLDDAADEIGKKAALGYLSCAKENGARDVFVAEGAQPVRRPGNYANSIGAAAVLAIAGKLNKRGG